MKEYRLGNSREGVISLFPERTIKQVSLGDQKVCVARIGERFFAFEGLCPHRMASLSEGWITAFDEVVCPLHQYRFELASGRVSSGDCRELICFKAILDDGGLLIYL
ncbi:MAG: Rieske 2Fe-2S domain-containing protein [Lunatimonas sp.]|uniref:Rieske (2Fe-2S) protein n=1 Tax=Lunatimonas sp. TaxID=2060141 RepID=UPI00263BB6FD|nr:Rieske 2Fe-2S domain-containing protein [Lunatimonas sp.]MCC5938462.1 Rieske 2Fe-2S domain-containing protein [Lunatimonas sp.]